MVTQLFAHLMLRMQDEEGQDLAEYALILVLVAVAAVVAVTALGTTVSGVFDTIVGDLGG